MIAILFVCGLLSLVLLLWAGWLLVSRIDAVITDAMNQIADVLSTARTVLHDWERAQPAPVDAAPQPLPHPVAPVATAPSAPPVVEIQHAVAAPVVAPPPPAPSPGTVTIRLVDAHQKTLGHCVIDRRARRPQFTYAYKKHRTGIFTAQHQDRDGTWVYRLVEMERESA